MLRVFHIVAVAEDGVIGKDNKLPWHFSEDLRFFKKITTGQTVIMGRKTYESIGKPLPNRQNFVLSRKGGMHPLLAAESPALRYFSSFEEAVGEVKTEKAFVIGGAEIYRQTLDKVDGIYLTRIAGKYEGDAFYPEIPEDFEEVEIEVLRDAEPRIEAVFYERRK